MVTFKKLKFWDNPIIEFYCHPDLEGTIPEPKSAVKYLPDWFKDLEPTYGNDRDNFGEKVMTAKKCLPLLDGMSLGFTIPLCGDLHINSNHNNSQINLVNPPGMVLCEFHDNGQVGGPSKLKANHGNPLKFLNKWVIKTAPGWSTLFINPLNHFDRPFTCLSALVDTDKYPKEVNFPGVLNIFDADICIPAGTPLVTAIPVKRNMFSKKPIVRPMDKSDFKKISKIEKIQNTRSHYYTYELREKK
jgi:hypothetical protein